MKKSIVTDNMSDLIDDSDHSPRPNALPLSSRTYRENFKPKVVKNDPDADTIPFVFKEHKANRPAVILTEK